MHRIGTPALAVVALVVATAARAQMEHPAGMSHQQVLEAAMAGGPASVSRNATIGWVDSTATFHQIQAGTNGFTCFISRPDPIAGPVKHVGNPIKMSELEEETPRPSPLLGQHTEELLKDLLGLSDAEIDALRADKVV